MMRSVTIAAVLSATLAVPPALAARFDGTQPFLCTTIDIVSCGVGRSCDKETAASVDMPQFLKFDVGQKQITGERPNGEMLKAVIDRTQHVEDRMLLQGIDGRIMWSAMIDEANGDLTITAGGDKIGFVAFGACTSG
jgi:hypothetical protein